MLGTRKAFDRWKKTRTAKVWITTRWIELKSKCELCQNKTPLVMGWGGLIRFNHMTIDHIVPLSEGGRNDISNYRLICRKCHHKINPNVQSKTSPKTKPNQNNQDELDKQVGKLKMALLKRRLQSSFLSKIVEAMI